ncbi:hypothetical protein EVAR_29776_1 [Eumeta japonica]|uniref:Uncharacterized protein n=1 Tax=Eumeta variegata TaxID=151549 RepID=A0A4C1WXZ0_EUMVA|nr:hypothetical protein EVAR_29776_1 [Eumeta japonica]
MTERDKSRYTKGSVIIGGSAEDKHLYIANHTSETDGGRFWNRSLQPAIQTRAPSSDSPRKRETSAFKSLERLSAHKSQECVLNADAENSCDIY